MTSGSMEVNDSYDEGSLRPSFLLDMPKYGSTSYYSENWSVF